jgi:hypothetical protein
MGRVTMVASGHFSERLTEYVVTVDGWDYLYSYIADPLTSFEVDEFIHLETLEFQGKLTNPRSKLSLSAKVRIACEKAPMDGEPTRYDRPVLGNVHAKKRILEAYVLLPATHVTRLTSIASSDRVKTLRITATRMVDRKALVRSIHFNA